MTSDRAVEGLTPKDRLIFALDVPTLNDAIPLVEMLRDEVGLFKVGLELYSSIGSDGLRRLMRVFGYNRRNVLLDLKLHDIPTTVTRTIRVLYSHLGGIKAVTAHCAGGPSMLKAAVNALGHEKDLIEGIDIFAVTALTSMSVKDVKAVDNFNDVESCVLARAKVAAETNCAAIIASPLEAKAIRKEVFGEGKNFIRTAVPKIVTPGIRMEGSEEDDQKRKATPYEAIVNGSDYIVVGRPIRDASSHVGMAREIVGQISAGIRDRAKTEQIMGKP